MTDVSPSKFIITLEVTFKKDTINPKTREHESIYKTAFFSSNAKTITKANDIKPEVNMSQEKILNMINIWISEGLGWVINKIVTT